MFYMKNYLYNTFLYERHPTQSVATLSLVEARICWELDPFHKMQLKYLYYYESIIICEIARIDRPK